MAFNDIIRKVRKTIFGKGPERIYTRFADNMAITIMHGNFTPTEKFIASGKDGKQIIHSARTQMIQDVYKDKAPDGLEDLAGSNLVHLFSDIKVEEDIAVSVFIFEKPIKIDN